MINVLVTGANGFVGKNLVSALEYRDGIRIYQFDKDTQPELLIKYCQTCDFVYHLAGVNRPEKESEFMEGNGDFTLRLLKTLQMYKNPCPVMFASSIQASRNNAYGISKRYGEELLCSYGKETGAPIYIYRFPNLFGKWCRPDYNSVVATFCHRIAHQQSIEIHDYDAELDLVYIDDVISSLLDLLKGTAQTTNYVCSIPVSYTVTVGKLANMIQSFSAIRQSNEIPDIEDGSFCKKLYSTYLSYLPQEEFRYPLTMHMDKRGSFTEIFKTSNRGQISVNICKPGIEKGNHWHHTKTEKFVVVNGKGLIQLRLPWDNKIISYHVTGEQLEVIDIPPGYTHRIVNEGECDLVTLMWCNECFLPSRPDTYSLDVIQKESETTNSI